MRNRRAYAAVAAAMLVAACTGGNTASPTSPDITTLTVPSSDAAVSTSGTDSVSTPASATTSTTQPAAGWIAIGSVTLTPGSDPRSFTVSGGEAGHVGEAFLALPPGRCDYVVSVEGRLVGDTTGWGLAVRSLPSGGASHFLAYVSKVGYEDSGDLFTGGPVEVHRTTDLDWHRLTIEVKGDLHTTSVDGEVVAQGQEFIEVDGTAPVSNDCGGVSLQLLSPGTGTVAFRNFVLSDPPVPFVEGHPCPKLHPATAYPLVLCDEGPLVRDLQSALDVRVQTTVDGQFGLDTQGSLRELQVRIGLPVTGILDTATASALGLPFNT